MATSSNTKKVLGTCKMFAGLDEDKIAEFASICEERSLAKGEVLMRQGERGDEIFVVASGRFDIFLEEDGRETKLNVIKPGGLMGEGQLVTGGVRSATVRAAVRSKVLVMMRKPWLALCEDTEIPHSLLRLVRTRFGRTNLHKRLRVRFPSGDESVIEELVDISEWLFLGDRELLFSEGDESEHFYFLLQGNLAVTVGGTKVNEIVAGNSFGEAAITGGGKRTASLLSIRPSLIARIGRDDFLEVANRHPGLLLDIIREMHLRVMGRDPRAKVEPKLGNPIIAVLPVSGDLDPNLVEDMIVDAFAAQGSVKILTEKSIVEYFANPEILEVRNDTAEELGLQLYFEALEAQYDYLVLVASGRSRNWMSRCALNANQLLLVGLAGDDVKLHASETLLQGRVMGDLPDKMMVVLRPSGTSPHGTHRWHDRFPLDHLLHVEIGVKEDYERLGRYLTKQAVGLCLSGGGALAFAGFGIITAMKELGIPIDAVGGVSAGAMVAALYCQTGEYQPMMDLMKKLMITQNAYGLLDSTNPPILSMTKGKYYRRAIRRVFGDIGIEDVALPLLLVSANVTSARQCVGTHGSFVEHFYATNAYPPFLPPAVIDGELHVDGGLMNNVPVAEVRSFVKGGPVVAMDVTPLKVFQELKDTPNGISGMEVLFNRLRPGGDRNAKWPTKAELESRLKMANHVRTMETRKAAADLYLQPDMTEFKIWDHFKYKKIGHYAHELIVEELAQWWDSVKSARMA